MAEDRSRDCVRYVSLTPLLIPVLLAQSEVYDIAAFTPPRGWRAERRQISITFTDIDPAARTYCILGVYASTPAFGGPPEGRAAPTVC